jgi:hypothetical protein
MREHMKQREIELQHLPGANERWENYMQYTQSRMVPRFTEKGSIVLLFYFLCFCQVLLILLLFVLGFEVIQIPPGVYQQLRDAVDAGLARFESLRWLIITASTL